MADINSVPPDPASPSQIGDDTLKQGLDLLVVATRDLMDDGDELLRSAGLGRAHARALAMIGRRPFLAVADLLSSLGITKQSLSRVLGDLLGRGLVEQHRASSDRRKRLLQLTKAGQSLDRALWEAQRNRMARAFGDAGPEAVAGFRKVLTILVERAPDHQSERGAP